ncbi:hypothetical protein UFOVP592_36 [uncultured Caudovirales phage]|uniref:Uncharacterized protein n=1 Tax=uncultured Caudovirales phage TaxID=2100421 RepID=A0A6J5N7T1_9CAUD|nr:hypothetical protein UFOVP592_36 [uncultured Caudovirales phage]
MEKNGRFLTAMEDQPPVILCERHAQAFEVNMIGNDIPHTIYEFDDEDPSQYCQACDLQKAKEYVKRRDNQPRIIMPGEFH